MLFRSYAIQCLSGIAGTVVFYTLYALVQNDLDNVGVMEKIVMIGPCAAGALLVSLAGFILSGVRLCSAFQSRQKALRMFFLEGNEAEFVTEEEDAIISRFVKGWKLLCLLCKLMCALPLIVTVLVAIEQCVLP